VRTKLIVALGVLILLALGGWVLLQRALGADLVRVQIEQRVAARLGQPVQIGSATAAIFPSVSIDLHDVRIGRPAAVQLARVRLLTGTRALFSRRIQDAELSLEDGRIAWPLPFSWSDGGGGGAASDGPSLTLISVRRIAFRNVTFATSLPPITVDLDAALAGDRLDVTRLSAKSDRNRLDATGAVTSIARLEAEFHATGFLTFAGYTARDVAGTISISPRGISLSPLAFSMFDGRFDGRLDVDLRGTPPQLRLQGAVRNVDVAAILTGAVTGRLGATLSIAGSGADGSALQRSARGPFTAKIADGTLPYIDIVRPVVLAFGKPSGVTPGGSGSSFSSLTGTFALTRGTISTDNLNLEARDFTAHGRTSLQVESGTVDSHLDVILSRELTQQAGSDLRRYAAEDGRVVVPATVGGTLTHPSVFVDPAEAMKRALSNELKRRAGALLDGLFKKKKGGGVP
jgi:uncharacterized protein involved in outer membrane biogenesis